LHRPLWQRPIVAPPAKDQELTIIVSMMLIELALLRLSILVCVIGLVTMLAL
jgi:hypothetical protein